MCLCWKDAFSSPVRASHSLALKSAEAVATRTACGSSAQDQTQPCSGQRVVQLLGVQTGGAQQAATPSGTCTSGMAWKGLLASPCDLGMSRSSRLWGRLEA
jgi:hypothetical protein